MPLVLTIHDLSYFAHPDWFSWREGLRRRWITRKAARRATAVVTISQFSAREIEQRLGERGVAGRGSQSREQLVHPLRP